MVNSMVVPSNEPLRMSPEPRSPEYVPVTRPSSACSVAVMLTSPLELFTVMRHVPSIGDAAAAAPAVQSVLAAAAASPAAIGQAILVERGWTLSSGRPSR
jgi:hypothetical protein